MSDIKLPKPGAFNKIAVLLDFGYIEFIPNMQADTVPHKIIFIEPTKYAENKGGMEHCSPDTCTTNRCG